MPQFIVSCERSTPIAVRSGELRAHASHSAAVPQKSYSQSLSVCRQRHSGRQNQRRGLAPTESHVAPCLRRFGWHPDGTSTLEAVIPAEGLAL